MTGAVQSAFECAVLRSNALAGMDKRAEEFFLHPEGADIAPIAEAWYSDHPSSPEFWQPDTHRVRKLRDRFQKVEKELAGLEAWASEGGSASDDALPILLQMQNKGLAAYPPDELIEMLSPILERELSSPHTMFPVMRLQRRKDLQRALFALPMAASLGALLAGAGTRLVQHLMPMAGFKEFSNWWLVPPMVLGGLVSGAAPLVGAWRRRKRQVEEMARWLAVAYLRRMAAAGTLAEYKRITAKTDRRKRSRAAGG